MSDHVINVDRVFDLAGAICDEIASQNDFVELDSIIVADSTSRRHYWNYCWIHIRLGMEARVHRVLQKVREQDDLDPSMLAPWESDALMVATPPAASSTMPLNFFTSTFHGTIGYFSHEIPFSFLIGAVLTSLLVLVAWLVPVSRLVEIADNKSSMPSVAQRQFTPESKMEMVGKITGMVDVKWADINTSTETGNGVLLGRKFALTSGLMEITYDTGAKVILQGPVTYEVESKNGGFMSIGKLTGKLEVEAAKGFFVHTPIATVTDLGTEFGVEVSKEGHTTSHVFRGSVKLQVVDVDEKAEGDARVLHEGESARVKNRGKQGDSNRIIMLAPSAKWVNFVRELPKRTITTLDLADIVAGGDGFSGRRNRGIDPTSGRVADRPPEMNQWDNLVGDGVYHRVKGLPLVDGVFIPDGGKGPVQVDSAGHVFANFPHTDNHTYGYVWAGTVKPAVYFPTCAMLGNENYASSNHGILDLLANKGVTFNLDAIRRANPGCRLLRFHTVVGHTGPVLVRGTYPPADVWVLVDGKPKYVRRKLVASNGPSKVAVPLAEDDHFLTLAATDNGEGCLWKWVVFCDPRLDMQTGLNVAAQHKRAEEIVPPANELGESLAGRTVFNANADMIANQTSGVPSSAYGVWLIGHRALHGAGEGVAGTNFHQFSGEEYTASEDYVMRGWGTSTANGSVCVNISKKVRRNSIGSFCECDQIVMHPAVNGSLPVLRWTAPRDGMVNVSTVFSAAHKTTTDVHLVLGHGGAVKTLYDGEINSQTLRLDASQPRLSVSAGDYIEVVVGYGSNKNYGEDSTGVFHSIAYVSEISNSP